MFMCGFDYGLLEIVGWMFYLTIPSSFGYEFL